MGTLEAGKLADLIVLSADPLAIAPDDLWDVEVLMTMIGAEVVFCRAGYEALCSPGE